MSSNKEFFQAQFSVLVFVIFPENLLDEFVYNSDLVGVKVTHNRNCIKIQSNFNAFPLTVAAFIRVANKVCSSDFSMKLSPFLSNTLNAAECFS